MSPFFGANKYFDYTPRNSTIESVAISLDLEEEEDEDLLEKLENKFKAEGILQNASISLRRYFILLVFATLTGLNEVLRRVPEKLLKACAKEIKIERLEYLRLVPSPSLVLFYGATFTFCVLDHLMLFCSAETIAEQLAEEIILLGFETMLVRYFPRFYLFFSFCLLVCDNFCY